MTSALHAPRVGFFLTLEGGEGTGKSTLIAALAARLRASGYPVVQTREPGGSLGAEMVRHVLLSGAAKPLGAFTEALLFAAARDDHLDQVIRPALLRGDIVLCDRFSDSTRAYQGALGGTSPLLLNVLERVVVGKTAPDLTLILDLPAEIGLARARRRSGAADRFEDEDQAFHQALRAAYGRIAREQSERCVLIDASGTPQNVEQMAMKVLTQRLSLKSGQSL